MYESHAIYKTVLAHNVVEPCASIDIQLTNDMGDALHLLLKMYGSVRDLAVVCGWFASKLAPPSA